MELRILISGILRMLLQEKSEAGEVFFSLDDLFVCALYNYKWIHAKCGKICI